MSKLVGIDLGTTNSVIAAMEGGQPTVIINAEGLRTTPSIVAYTKKEELLIGQIAKRQTVINPENTFFSVKRFIGLKYSEISEDSQKIPYTILPDKMGNIKIKCEALNKEFSPEEISAQVLRKLINDAKTYLRQDVTQAVITVPAYFTDSQRQATMDAGKIAGLDVLRILNEPTAASLAYGLDKNLNELILVFDLGGGTFDVSILEVGETIFEVLATSGDTNLGGNDFDQILVDWLIKSFNEKENIDLSNDIQALQRLNEAAEKAKIDLSIAEKIKINLPFITADDIGPKHIEEELTRSEFETLAQDLILRCKTPIEKALHDAGLKKEQLNEIVLVGGSTRMPAITKLVQSVIKKTPNQSVNPDEVVAIGAAIQGSILAGDIKDILLLDVTPLSLGLETFGGFMTKLIARNTTIPAKKSEIFTTAINNQTCVDIHVLQGERELVSGNKTLGIFRLDGIPNATRGIPQINVVFDINTNGILSVIAKEQETGIEQSVIIENTSTLEESEIKKMLEDAEKYAESDAQEKLTTLVKNKVNNVCSEIEKQLLIFKSIFPKKELNELETFNKNVLSKLNVEDIEVLHLARKKLESEFQDLLNQNTKFTISSFFTEP